MLESPRRGVSFCSCWTPAKRNQASEFSLFDSFGRISDRPRNAETLSGWSIAMRASISDDAKVMI